MLLPDSLREALLALRPIGRPRLVGGCVRDWLMGIASKDFDVEVGGVDFPLFTRPSPRSAPPMWSDAVLA